MTPAQLKYLQEIHMRALPGAPLPESGEAIVDDLLRATLRARGTLNENTLVHASFAALDIIGQRRRELPGLIATAIYTRDGRAHVHLEERKNA